MDDDQLIQEVDSILKDAHNKLLQKASNEIHDAFFRTRISILETRRQLHDDLDSHNNPEENRSILDLIRRPLTAIGIVAVIVGVLALFFYLMDKFEIAENLYEILLEVFS